MRASSVITQLLASLPQLTDKFTDDLAIASAAYSSPTLTLGTSAAHGLVAGNLFHLVATRPSIPISSFTRVGQVGTIVFARDHDRVLHTNMDLNFVATEGATEPEFNGSFAITGVPNRLTLVVRMTDAGATTATGSPVGTDVDRLTYSYSRLYSVATAPTATSITATSVLSNPAQPDTATAIIRARPRIAGAVNLDRALSAYTKQATDKFWAYVVMGDVTASRGIEHLNDATDQQFRDTSFRQVVVSPFSIVVVAPAADDVAARRVRDEMTDLWGPLCRSLLGFEFPSTLSSALCRPVNFVGHGTLVAERGFLAHGFSFEALEELEFGDTTGYSESVAFRDVEYSITPDLSETQGDGVMTGTIDLDEDA